MIENLTFASPAMLLGLCAGFAFLLLLFGAVGLYAGRDRTADRMRSLSAGVAATGPMQQPRRAGPRAWHKALIPQDEGECAQIRLQLAKVGFQRDDAIAFFFLFRTLLAFAVPLIVLSGVALSNAGMAPAVVADWVAARSTFGLFQLAIFGTAVGFYGPGYWLQSRIKARKQRIRAAFPNALDLVQIAIEAGLGFDAAITRVGHALGRVAPDVAQEFLQLQLEIQAGRERQKALFDMADRMGIDEAKSFALVISQSMQFGTSLTDALKTYAQEMRELRELLAQEKANKLPVQMSGVMSVLMLPALFMITLTPIIIRYMGIY